MKVRRPRHLVKRAPRGPDRRTCVQCGATKNRRGFRGQACLLCVDGPKAVVRRKPAVPVAPSPMTVELLRELVAPSATELAAVLECVRRMVECPGRPRGTYQHRDGPEAAIDAVTRHWVRRIQLGSLALQMVRER